MSLSPESIKALKQARDFLDDNIYRYVHLGKTPENDPRVVSMQQKRDLLQQDIDAADPTGLVR